MSSLIWGEPTTTPKAFDKPESLKAMLELDLKIKKQDVQNYVEHARLADELGEVELKLKLEEMAADEAGHARELWRLLKGYSQPIRKVNHDKSNSTGIDGSSSGSGR
jgi:bacterioferritin